VYDRIRLTTNHQARFSVPFGLARVLPPPVLCIPPYPTRSVVLHNMNMVSHKSTFPVDIGVKITGVDSNTFSLTGESYAAVLPAESKSETARKLQSDDVALGAFLRFECRSHFVSCYFFHVATLCSNFEVPTHETRSNLGMHSVRVSLPMVEL